MKRRQVITGFMGLTATTMVSRWGALIPEQPYDITGVSGRDSIVPDTFDFDPLSDRERPVILSSLRIEQIDERDSQKMMSANKVVSHQHSEKKPIAEREQSISVSSTSSTIASAPNPSRKLSPSVNKNIDFARDYSDDIFVAENEKVLLHSVFSRLKNLQKTIGFGHFNLVGFDETLKYAKRFKAVGEFTSDELQFIEKMFFTNAADYGFYGDKVNEKLTSEFKKSDAIKIPGSGHYIFKSDSLAYYQKLRKDVGESIILTSGIRSNIKQLYLFLAKTVRVNGNLSRASRSLAPPGYSYHGIGDFDVGRVGWGGKNFTDDFASTDEFKRMRDLGYIAIRYSHGNDLGVRFEPWHIKVV